MGPSYLLLEINFFSFQGKYSFDPVSKLLMWEVGKIDQTKLPNIKGNVNFVTGARPEDVHANISVHFSINQLAVSGLKVNRLNVT